MGVRHDQIRLDRKSRSRNDRSARTRAAGQANRGVADNLHRLLGRLGDRRVDVRSRNRSQSRKNSRHRGLPDNVTQSIESRQSCLGQHPVGRRQDPRFIDLTGDICSRQEGHNAGNDPRHQGKRHHIQGSSPDVVDETHGPPGHRGPKTATQDRQQNLPENGTDEYSYGDNDYLPPARVDETFHNIRQPQHCEQPATEKSEKRQRTRHESLTPPDDCEDDETPDEQPVDNVHVIARSLPRGERPTHGPSPRSQ